MRKAKFKVGQIVRVNTKWYRSTRKDQQYQRITQVWRWTPTRCPQNDREDHRRFRDLGYGYNLLNGDEAHQKYLQPLTQKERGVQ
jgi:hypothetical protein